jgi:Flp pilus assembly pilin Flp
MLKRLWTDEGGAILSAELILIMTILVIGLIVGLKTLQDAVVTELADVAQAIGALNQSYSFTGFQDTGCGTTLAMTPGSSFTDAMDLEDEGASQTACMSQNITVLQPSSTAGG